MTPAAILMATILGHTMPVREYSSYEECEHQRTLVFELIKTSTTKYWCEGGRQ